MMTIYKDLKIVLKIFAIIYFIVLPVLFWAFDPGTKQQQYRKAHLHHEDSPAWFMNQ